MVISLEEEVRNLEKVQVDAEILKKEKSKWLSRLSSYGAFICRFHDSAGKIYTDFVRCNESTYNNKEAGEIIHLTAYKGIKKGDLYLQPYRALWEKK